MNMLELLINDLMDLAKIENNKFTLNNSYFNLIDTIETTLNILLYQGNYKQIKFEVQIDKKENLRYV